MEPRRWIRRFAMLLVVAPALAVSLSFVASLVPDRLILGELAGAVQRDEVILFPQVGISGRGLDTFSDCIALTMGLGETEGGTATIWLRSPTLGSCDTANPSILAYEAGEGLSGGYEYFRYWHGYTIVSRPLLAVLGVTGQRIVLFWMLIGAVALLARRLLRFHGALAPIALLAPLLLTTDTIELARSIPHGMPALVAVLGAWVLHRVSSQPDRDGHPRDPGTVGWRRDLDVATAAFLAGAAYVFVDLLTTPPGAWALASGIAVLAAARHRRGGLLARRGAVAMIAWITGYAWTWLSKWAIAIVVLGYDRVRSNVGDAIDDRLVGERDYIDPSLFNAIDVNFDVWMDHPLTPPVLIAIAITAAVTASRNEWPSTWPTRLLIAAPAALPLLWFEVLRNHSLVHPLFVYRSFGVTAGLVALALIVGPRSIDGSQPAAGAGSPPDDEPVAQAVTSRSPSSTEER